MDLKSKDFIKLVFQKQKTMNKILSLFFVVLLSSCTSSEDLRVDLHSFSEPHNVITTHLDLDLEF